MTKILINNVLRDMTTEEISERETDVARAETKKTADETARTNLANLKASAKAKLIAGDPLTEDEANTIVI